MKLFNYKSLRSAFVVISVLLVFSGCEKDDETSGLSAIDNLDAKLTSKTELSIFQAALAKARLTNFTKGGGPYTLWAPNNAAFNAIGINSAADLSLIDSNLLVQILTYHLQSGRRSYLEIPLGPNASMTTQGGFTQYASRKVAPNTPKAYINGVAVVEPDVVASNGFLHVIDRVLFPPVLTAAQTLSLQPNYARFYQAILKTGTVISSNPLTIFAVDNARMIAAGYDSTTIAMAATTVLTNLTNTMKYHTVAKRIFSPDFIPGALQTVFSTGKITVAGTVGSFTLKGTNNPAPFSIVTPDIVTTTGVIHAINGVLKP